MVTKRSFGKQSAFVSSIMYTLLVVAFCFVCTSARAMALYTYAFFTQTYTPWPGPPLTETIVGPNAELNFLSLTLSEDVGVLSFNWAPTCDNDVCLREDVGIESATFSGYIYDPHSFAAGMFFGNYDLMTAGSIIEVGRYQMAYSVPIVPL